MGRRHGMDPDLDQLQDDRVAVVEACGEDMFQIKRAYEPAASADGFRVLVDRLWPRGLSKEDAAIDEWLKDIAPSAELRKWFGHDPKRWVEFKARYRQELRSAERSAALARLRDAARTRGSVTLLFAARDMRHNHAAVLLEVLNEQP
jgi:uncharacterized protein YeaO (DUF488 family)